MLVTFLCTLPLFLAPLNSHKGACGNGVYQGHIETIHQFINTRGLTHVQGSHLQVSLKQSILVGRERSGVLRRQQFPQEFSERARIDIRTANNDIVHMHTQHHLDPSGWRLSLHLT